MALIRFGSRNRKRYNDYFSTTIFSSSRSYSVTEEQAMQIPAVKSCVELISSTISQLPIYLYKELPNGDVEQIDDERLLMLNNAANKYDSASKIKKLIVKNLLLYGKAYLYRKDNELHHLPANKVHMEEYTEDDITISMKTYTYHSPTSTVTLSEDEIIVFETGTEGVLVDGEQVLQQALNELDYSKNVLKNGALPIGVLKASTRLTEAALNRLKQSFNNLYSSTKNAGKTIVLEEGLDYQPISLNPNELQLNEVSKQTLASICRLFNVPQAMVDASANKYSSLEMNNLHFLQYTISPLINVIESTLNQRLLDEYEQQNGLYFRFDTSEVLRVTEKELVDTTINLFKNGLISANEARARLDKKRIDKDYFVLNLGSVLKDAETNELTIINLGQTLKQSKIENQGGEINNNENDGIEKQQNDSDI